MFPKVAGIRLPWPQGWQVRYRKENLPREARTHCWSHWAADQGSSLRGTQCGQASAPPNTL